MDRVLERRREDTIKGTHMRNVKFIITQKRGLKDDLQQWQWRKLVVGLKLSKWAKRSLQIWRYLCLWSSGHFKINSYSQFNDTYTTTQTKFGNTGIGPLNKKQNSECCRVQGWCQFRIVKILQCHFLFRSHSLPLSQIRTLAFSWLAFISQICFWLGL